MSSSNIKNDLPFDEKYFFEHKDRLPVIRISRIEINGFKSVEHGEVILDCGKQFIPHGVHSDILGIYGQNGSGKTSLIEALSILKMVMSGDDVTESCCDCISVKTGVSTLIFAFDFQYLNGEVKTAEYKFSIEKIKLSRDEIEDKWKKRFSKKEDSFDDSIFDDERMQYKIRVFDEIVKIKNESGEKSRLNTIIDTSGKHLPFGPSKKIRELIGTKKEANIILKDHRDSVSNNSESFVFSKKTLKIFIENGPSPLCYEILLALRVFAKNHLFIIDTESTGLIGLNFALPVFTKNKIFINPMWQKRISVEKYNEISEILSNMSTVLTQLVPGLSIGLKKVSETVMSDGKPGYMALPVAHRGDIEIPLRDESDGVRKIISVLSLIIAAYNDESITIAIDEFDAGIFEYLLGEILQSFEESGKGQFIFTSHNLRPLEVIDKKFLVFTTTNENNRYYRFKDLSLTNNLRDKYFREIILGGQEEKLYNKTKRFKIESAMRKAYEE